MIGIDGPAAQPADHVDAVDARAARGRAARDRAGGRGLGQAPPRRSAASIDVVAVGAQVDVECPADPGLVVDDQDPGHGSASSATGRRIVHRQPAARCVVETRCCAPIASMNPLAIARPRPTPASFDRSPSRWNGRKMRSRSSWGSRARGRRCAGRCAPPTWPASTLHRAAPSGDHAKRVRRPGWRRPARAARHRRARSATIRTRRRRPGPARRQTARARRGTTSSSATDRSVESSAPACRRLMSSRSRTMRSSRSAASSMSPSNSRRSARRTRRRCAAVRTPTP